MFHYWLLCIIFTAEASNIVNIPVGAILDDEPAKAEGKRSNWSSSLFRYAVDYANRHLKNQSNTFRLSALIHYTPPDDRFFVTQKTCAFIQEGIGAIFGPGAVHASLQADAICKTFDIPHIELRPSFAELDAVTTVATPFKLPGADSPWSSDATYSINLYPHYSAMSYALLDLVNEYDWADFTILYQRNEDLIKFERFFRDKSSTAFKVSIRKLQTTAKDRFKPLFKYLVRNRETRLIIDCEPALCIDVLEDELSINENMNKFRFAGANITCFQQVSSESAYFQTVLQDLERQRVRHNQTKYPRPRDLYSLKGALLFDGVQVLASAIEQLSNGTRNVTFLQPVRLNCDGWQVWGAGADIRKFLLSAEQDGLTGPIKFDEQYGTRTGSIMDVVHLGVNGFHKVGQWNSSRAERLEMLGHSSQDIETLKSSLVNKTLRVTTILEAPFTMLKPVKPGIKYENNDRFEGFCIDLIEQIAQRVAFNYSIHVVKDNNYGSPVETSDGKIIWTGMVGELVYGEADIAVAPLTISYVREEVIDFTKPFMNLGISILYKRPEPSPPTFFNFLRPLNATVWLYLLIAYVSVSVVIYCTARLSPFEWLNPVEVGNEAVMVENQFTLLNSFWFTVSALMQQGCDISPRSTSCRIISTLWWLFILIMISTYTANLAASLTFQRLQTPISNADDLSKQNEIRYGIQYGGSTMSFFKRSRIKTFEAMWNFMESAVPSVFVNSTAEGIKRVKDSNGKYAYLMESVMIEYQTQRDCSLMQIGGLLDSKGYGVGLPRDSPVREAISNMVLKLQEEQVIQLLYNRWWRERGVIAKCDQSDNQKDPNELGMGQFGGVFALLYIGVAVGIATMLIEFVIKRRNNTQRKSLGQQLLAELYAAFRWNADSKKVISQESVAGIKLG